MSSKKLLALTLGLALLAMACNRNEKILHGSAERASAMCPITVDHTFTLSGVNYEPGDKYFTFTYLVDENQSSIQWLRGSAEYATGEQFKNFMSSVSDLDDLLKICSAEGLDIRHVYQGRQSEEKFSIIYNPKTNSIKIED